jgi:apolipoprotein N-acyltransferase
VRVEPATFPLGFVAYVPWLAALERARSSGEALRLGLLLQVGFALGVFGWFGPAIAGYTGAPLAVGYAVLVLVAPLLQPQLLVWAAARHAARGAGGGVRGGRALAALAGALAYVGAEWALPKLFGDTVGHGFLASRLLRQAAELAGAGGLTLALLLVNECALAGLRGGLRARAAPGERLHAALLPAALAAALLAGLALYGALRLRALEPRLAAAPRARVAVVQADISRYGRMATELGTGAAVARILDAHLELSGEALARGPLDLLVWPETVYPTTFGAPKSEEGGAFDRVIGKLVEGSGVPLVFGSYDTEGADEYNAAFFLERDGAGRVGFDAYRKAALFPLTERVPAWLEPLRPLLPWLGTWKAGDGTAAVPLATPGGRDLRAAPLICYDAVVPELAREAVRRGADLIVTLSNDSWFASGEGPNLHLTVSAFRSLETRRAQARATNTGISALILPTGEIVARAGVHERAALVGDLPLVSGIGTPALALGDWLGPGALAGAALLLASARRGLRASSR